MTAKWEKVRLGDIVKITKGTKVEQTDPSLGTIRFIQIEDLRNDNCIKWCVSSDKYTKITQDDVVIAWDGANAGTIGYGLSGVIGSTLAKISFNRPVVSEYIGLYLQGKFEYLQETCNGATIPHINRKALDNLQIPLPPLDEQKRIADVLDKASELIKKRKEQIRLMDQLARSLFIEMFGDPVENPMMWELKILGDLGAFKNGINYGQKDTGYSVKILGVGDFKSQNIFDNIDSLSSVRLTKKPNSDYFLNDGDIIFVRSNGSRELVGRNIIIYPRGKLVTFSGFCIRFRVLSERILPSYLQNLLLIPSQKSLLLENGRGCNIQNLNQQMLSSINIPLPPLSLQNEFANRIAVIEQQKALLQNGLAKMETAYKALMQEYFG